MKNEKTIQNILIVFVLMVATLGIGIQSGLSFSGEWKTLSEDGTAEIQYLNSSHYYLDGTSINSRLQGTWDVDLSTPNIDSSGYVNASEFYLNGDPLYLSIPAIVGEDSDLDYITNYWYVDGTADEVQVQAAYEYLNNTLNGGALFLDVPSLTFSASVNMTGGGSRSNPDKEIEIYGRGQFSTTINQAENHYAFKMNDGAIVHFHDFEIIIPSTNAKTAIFGDDDGANIKNSVIYAKFGNLNIEGGDGSECYAVHLKAPIRWCKYGVTRTQMNGGAGCWQFENTDTLNWGDGCIDGYHQNIINNDNMVGYTFKGTSSGSIGPIIGSGFVYVTAWSGDNLTAIKGDYWDTSHIRIQAEHMDNFINIYEGEGLRIEGPYISMDTAGLLFNLTDCWDCEIGPFHVISVVNQTTIFYDNQSVERGVTYYHDISVKMVSGTPIIGTYNSEIKFLNVEINQKFSEDSDVATVLNGWNNVTVTHNLWDTPTIVFITPYSGQLEDCYVHTIGSTTFIIQKASGTVTANRGIAYHCQIGRWP